MFTITTILVFVFCAYWAPVPKNVCEGDLRAQQQSREYSKCWCHACPREEIYEEYSCKKSFRINETFYIHAQTLCECAYARERSLSEGSSSMKQRQPSDSSTMKQRSPPAGSSTMKQRPSSEGSSTLKQRPSSKGSSTMKQNPSSVGSSTMKQSSPSEDSSKLKQRSPSGDYIYFQSSKCIPVTTVTLLRRYFEFLVAILCAFVLIRRLNIEPVEHTKMQLPSKSYSMRTMDILFRFRTFRNTAVCVYPFSLNQYSDDIMKESKSGDELMQYEWARFLSFKTFPQEAPVSPLKLAQAGFYYTGRDQEAKCFCCGTTNGNWTQGETAMQVHRRFNPSCKYAIGETTNNVEIHAKPYYNDIVGSSELSQPTEHGATSNGATGGPSDLNQQPYNSENIGSSHATKEHSKDAVVFNGNATERQASDTRPMKHPQYASLEARMASFVNWTSLDVQDPAELAASGFFYAGMKDFVRCYFCGVGLKNWEREDDPWVEHARWSESCGHLCLHSSSSYGRSDDHKETSAQDEETTAERNGINTENINNAGTTSTATDETPERQSQASNTPVARGHDSYPPTGRSQLDDTDVTAASGTATVTESFAKNDTPSLENAPANNTSVSQGLEKSKMTKQAKSADAMSLSNENAKLKEQMRCKICMDSDVNVVFLPCGHMVSCHTCAVSLRKCAVCRKLIRGIVRVYQS